MNYIVREFDGSLICDEVHFGNDEASAWKHTKALAKKDIYAEVHLQYGACTGEYAGSNACWLQ